MPQHVSLQQQPQQPNHERVLGNQQHYGLLGNSQQQVVRSRSTLLPTPTTLPQPMLGGPSQPRQPSAPAPGDTHATTTTMMPAPQVAAAAAALKSFMGDEGPRQQRRHSAAAVAVAPGDLSMGVLPPLMQAMQVVALVTKQMAGLKYLLASCDAITGPPGLC